MLEGRFLIDLEGETIELGPHQGYTVPKGVNPCTRAPERTVLLMVEQIGHSVVQQARRSLHQLIDEAVVVQWMLNFFRTA